MSPREFVDALALLISGTEGYAGYSPLSPVLAVSVNDNAGDSRGPCIDVNLDGELFTIWVEPLGLADG